MVKAYGTSIKDREITKRDVKKLELNIDSESVTIVLPSQYEYPIVYWHIDEVEEDSSVAFSMINAVNLYHSDRFELLRRLGYTIK